MGVRGSAYWKSVVPLGGIDLVQDGEFARRGQHILGDDVQNTADAAEIIILRRADRLVLRIMGMQAVRLILFYKALACDNEDADFANFDLGRVFHQQFISILEIVPPDSRVWKKVSRSTSRATAS